MNTTWQRWFAAALLCAGLALGARAAEFDCAPLLARDTDVFGRARWRALGPLLEWRHSPTGGVEWAVRPLVSTVRDPADQHVESDIVWPIWTRERMDREAAWSFLVLVHGINYDISRSGGRYKFIVFPLYFQGRDRLGKNYLALVPAGGVIRDFLARDAIWFVLFPLTYNDRINEAVTHAWLWPIVSRTTGGGHDRFRVFPVYGYTRFRMDYEKQFLLWPVWTSARYRYPGATGGGFILFPLMGHMKLTDQESWMAVPPFFRFSRGAAKSEVHCPWPLFQWSTGTVDRLYLWPFWGRKSMEGNDSFFVLWPLYRQARRVSDREERSRTMLMPVLYATRERQRDAEDPEAWRTTARGLKVWPLFSYRRLDDRVHLHLLSLFPFMDYAPVVRNYEALWTLYTHAAAGPLREDELLWGLFRWRRDDGGLRHLSLFPLFEVDRAAGGAAGGWSLLKGLAGVEWTGDRTAIRLLYGLRF